MDPAEERREMKKQKEQMNMADYVADAQYRIPTSCPCGGRIIDEVVGKEDIELLPGKRFFTCQYYENDGMHFRQPWVLGVQEEIEKLNQRLEVSESLTWGMPKLMNEIYTLEDEVRTLKDQVASLIGQLIEVQEDLLRRVTKD